MPTQIIKSIQFIIDISAAECSTHIFQFYVWGEEYNKCYYYISWSYSERRYK